MTDKAERRAQRKRHEEAADWILRLNEPDLTTQDRQAFSDWLHADLRNRQSFEAAQALMGNAGIAIRDDASGMGAIRLDTRRTATKSALALALLLTGSSFFLWDGPMRLRANVISGSNETPLVTLEDGSSVLLNARSAVAYTYTGTERKITLLRGEALFTVAPDKKRPFVVEAASGRTTAVGTAFDIHIGDEATDVTVVEHAVTIEAGATSSGIQLEEGQQTAYRADGKISPVKAVPDLNATLAWRRGELAVDNETLAYVVAEIGRRFSGRIIIANKNLAERRVSGHFSIIDTEDALAFLERTLEIKVTRLGPLIILREG